MRKTASIVVIAVLGLAVLVGCRRPAAEQRRRERAERRAERLVEKLADAAGQDGAQVAGAMRAIKEAAEAMEAAEAAGPVEPVDFRKLREALPESAGPARRTSVSGEKSGIGGFQISRAEADYAVGDGRVRASIVDMGGAGTTATMMLAAWTMVEVDRETESAYEKTSTLDGHRSLERFNSEARSGSLDVLVGGRFLVELNGTRVSMDDLKTLFRHLDTDKLVSLLEE